MKIIQLLTDNVKSPVRDRYLDCINQVRLAKPLNVSYKLLKKSPYTGLASTEDYRYESDLIRLKLAIDNPDMVWLDADIQIESWWMPPADGRPYFFNLGGTPDVCAFYVNGNKTLFKKLWNMYDKKLWKFGLTWMQGVLSNSPRDQFGFIPANTFKHLSLSQYRGIYK